jgi:hypothetical protein
MRSQTAEHVNDEAIISDIRLSVFGIPLARNDLRYNCCDETCYLATKPRRTRTRVTTECTIFCLRDLRVFVVKYPFSRTDTDFPGDWVYDVETLLTIPETSQLYHVLGRTDGERETPCVVATSLRESTSSPRVSRSRMLTLFMVTTMQCDAKKLAVMHQHQEDPQRRHLFPP